MVREPLTALEMQFGDDTVKALRPTQDI